MIPGLTLLHTGSRDAKLLVDFDWDTIDKCVQTPTIAATLADVGFEQARSNIVVPGAFCEYVGGKPTARHAA